MYFMQKSARRSLIAILAIVVLIVVAGGAYMLGNKSAGTQAEKTATDLPPGFSGKAGSANATPGTKGLDGPTPLADGSFDATIFGPAKELKSADDILNVHRRNAKDPFAVGAVDAPLVITEFSDFECPFCARWSNQTEPTLMEEYVSKGLVRIEWNDLPVNGEHALAAAKAGRAAAAQGKFDEFRKALFEASRNVSGHPNNTLKDFERFARNAGVKDMERFSREAQDSTYDEVLAKAADYAHGLGVSGTPAFVVGTQYISGAQPTEEFIKVIESELKKSPTFSTPSSHQN
ncbi:thioredoxin domain-containing protein [Corynebacterium diphtheriae]|uniref:thioredoxin domain-containing protein n=1 Tax=Corynebacterium diphtheriae TaxID=1717 RepID=UPI000892E58D|nr:thioredoxin domain-containing protein [Corynebacterium diphtheriae]OFI51946.1 disulfide bond formation protein DsbA [Corynebacterium diphtheriae]OSQ22291.1 disulfide bond formation protein DsbA [Corynebacterium diphtheriae]OSQ28335.1 disulfide bond formation protein DsbA [Corynebacterium diphtheriae]OWN39422.1 disulfide bond formation protein DsbA [Corynebacterium diphtheriae bv. gravis]OWN71292.1 disulfide bond formation protein DsbA [Corynebacterium diphtheriae bv. gravis]